MNCPFCQHANAATARACRVCGAPLGAPKPVIAPVAVVAPTPTFSEIARQTFDENPAELVSASFLPGENSAVCLIRKSGVVQLWDAQSNELSSFSVERRFGKSSPLCCALATANFVAIGRENGEVRWHDWNGRARKSPTAHVGRVLSLAANETHFYSGGSDGVIFSSEMGAKKMKSRAIIEGLGAMTTFAAAPDARSIAVGRDDGAIELWRVNAEHSAAKLDWTRRSHQAPLASLLFSANGQSLVSRDKMGALCLWAAQTSYQLPLAPRAASSHGAPALACDNRLLALCDARGVSVFDVAPGTLFCELPSFGEAVTHLAFATEAPWLLVAGARQIAVWEI